MPCHEMVKDGKVIGHLCMSTIKIPRYTCYREAKWCFACRSYEIHHERAFFQDWYGWNFRWECSQCGKDRTQFG